MLNYDNNNDNNNVHLMLCINRYLPEDAQDTSHYINLSLTGNHQNHYTFFKAIICSQWPLLAKPNRT